MNGSKWYMNHRCGNIPPARSWTRSTAPRTMDGSANEEADRLSLTDLVIAARRKADLSPVWIAVEASGTIAQDDISKVSSSAAALRSVYGSDAVESGRRISDPTGGHAARRGCRYLREDRRTHRSTPTSIASALHRSLLEQMHRNLPPIFPCAVSCGQFDN